MALKLFAIGFIAFFLIIQNKINANPIKKSWDPEYTAGAIEGDMILTPSQVNMLFNPISGRNGLLDETKRWPNNLVYYKFVGDFDADQIGAIRNAITMLEARTCVRFSEADDSQENYIAIGSKPNGCFTAVGFQGKAQEMNLQKFPVGAGCFRTGSILHEFMHALGFYHEQSAADRDDYITVIYKNIMPGKEFNFKKYTSTVVTDFGVGYDYDSCLHYSEIAFSENGGETILPLDPSAKIGQRRGLSKKDIDKINVMYKCPIPI